jgi:hypothetical protein
MRDMKLFKASLTNHPGLTVAIVWMLGFPIAALQRKNNLPMEEVSIAAWVALTAMAMLPWIPVLFTAWTRRHKYEEELE